MRRQTMGRIILWVLILLCTVSLASAEKAYSSGNTLQVAVAPSGLWLYEQDTLKWYGSTAFEPVEITKDGTIVTIAADAMTDAVWCLTEENGVRSLYAMGNYGLAAQAAVPVAAEIRQMAFAGVHGLFALDGDGRLCSVYTAEAQLTPITIEDWINADVTAFAAWEDHLLAYKAASGELALIDLPGKRLAYPGVTAPGLACVQIGESASALALTQSGGMIRIDLADGSQEAVPAEIPADCVGLQRDDQRVYTLGDGGRTLYALPIRELLGKPAGMTLTIVHASREDPRFQAAEELFHETYPDVEVVIRNFDDFRVVATEMMGGQEGIDIVGLQDSMMLTSAALMLRSGAILDLNKFPELVALKSEYRDIFGALTIGGQWYAAPNGVDQHPWRVNETLAKQLGWEIPEGRWTWDDFMALADRVRTWNETAEKPMLLLQDDNFLMPYFLQEYQANHVDALHGEAAYRCEAYVALLTRWKQLHDDGLVYTSPRGMIAPIQPNALLYAQRTNLPSMGTAKYIYPPTETLDARLPVYAYNCYAINANTPHLEEAVHFLACYMSPAVAAKEYYWNYGQWLKDDSLYVKEMPWGPDVSEENEALWNDMLLQGTPELYLYDISRKQSNTLMPGLLEGTVTPEEFAAISQQLADMALGE